MLLSLPQVSHIDADTDSVEIHSGRCGFAAELRATANLLELGHAVAKPVVDDAGVDLVVNYRLKVQVKATRALQAGYLRVHLTNGAPNWCRTPADVLIVYDRNKEVFYVLPVADLPAGRKFVLTPKYEVYREAWHLFD